MVAYHAVQSTIAGMGTDHSDGMSSYTQSIDHCPADVIIESTSICKTIWVVHGKTEFL